MTARYLRSICAMLMPSSLHISCNARPVDRRIARAITCASPQSPAIMITFTVSILPHSKFGTFVLLPSASPGAILVFMEATQMNKLTVKQALSQDVIRKHWQPAYKCYFYSADGCGDTLFPTAFSALGTWELKQSAKVVRS